MLTSSQSLYAPAHLHGLWRLIYVSAQISPSLLPANSSFRPISLKSMLPSPICLHLFQLHGQSNSPNMQSNLLDCFIDFKFFLVFQYIILTVQESESSDLCRLKSLYSSALTNYFHKIDFILLYRLVARFLEGLFASGFRLKCYTNSHLLHARDMSCSFNPSQFQHSNNTI